MDPLQTWMDLCDALEEDDQALVIERAGDLIQWIRQGFSPIEWPTVFMQRLYRLIDREEANMKQTNLFDLLRAAAKNGQGYVNLPLVDKLESKMKERKVQTDNPVLFAPYGAEGK